MNRLVLTRKKCYNIVILCTLILGIILRLAYLGDIPPQFYIDEGIPQLILLMHGQPLSFFEYVRMFIPRPLLVLIVLIKNLDLRMVFLLQRLNSFIIGTCIMLLLVYLGKVLIENNELKLIYVICISVSYPFLIHYSRYGAPLTSSLFYLISIILLYKVIEFMISPNAIHKKRNINLRFLALTLSAGFSLGLALIDIKALPYIFAAFFSFLLVLMKLVRRNSISNARTIMLSCIVVFIGFSIGMTISSPLLINLVASKTAHSLFPLTSSFIEQKIERNFNMKYIPRFINIILYFHPSFLLFDGGISIMHKGIGKPFSTIGDQITAYRWNAGYGVLGLWGWVLYLSLVYVISKTDEIFKKELRRERVFFLFLFLTMVLACITSLPLFKFDNPIAIREQIFLVVSVPLCFYVVGFLRNKMLVHMLLIFVILNAIVFQNYYYVMYANNTLTKLAFLNYVHKCWHDITNELEETKEFRHRILIIQYIEDRKFMFNTKSIDELYLWYLMKSKMIKKCIIGRTTIRYFFARQSDIEKFLMNSINSHGADYYYVVFIVLANSSKTFHTIYNNLETIISKLTHKTKTMLVNMNTTLILKDKNYGINFHECSFILRSSISRDSGGKQNA